MSKYEVIVKPLTEGAVSLGHSLLGTSYVQTAIWGGLSTAFGVVKTAAIAALTGPFAPFVIVGGIVVVIIAADSTTYEDKENSEENSK